MEKHLQYFDIGFKSFLAILAAVAVYVYSTQKRQDDDVKLVVDMAFSNEPAKTIAGLSLAEAFARDQRIPAEVYGALIAYAQLVPDRKVQAAARASAENASGADAVLARYLGRSLDTLSIDTFPARIYLHIRQDSDREAAKRLETKLEARGAILPELSVSVPDIEVLHDRGPSESELRCFRKTECAGLGKKLEAFLQRQGITISLKDLSAQYEQKSAIRRNHFEAWFTPGLRVN